MFNKKKSAIDLTELAIGIILVGIVVSIGVTVLTNFRNSRTDSLATITGATNETLTSVTGTGKSLAHSWANGISLVQNASGGELISSGNYTLVTDNDLGVSILKSITSGKYNNTNWNVTYTIRNTSDSQWAVPDKAAIGLGETGNWFKILVIIGVAAIVLGLIFVALGNKKGGMSDSPAQY